MIKPIEKIFKQRKYSLIRAFLECYSPLLQMHINGSIILRFGLETQIQLSKMKKRGFSLGTCSSNKPIPDI